MKILITRHGQTNWNVLGKIQGQTDIELNENGKKQAKEISEYIRNENIELIITSPLKRAKETAEIVNKTLNVCIIEDERLMERCFGEYEGLTKEDRLKLKERNPEINDIWNYNKNISFNTMETMHDFCKRVYEFLEEIIKKYSDKNILLVTHGGTTLPLLCYLKKCSLEKITDKNTIKTLENCEIVKFEI